MQPLLRGGLAEVARVNIANMAEEKTDTKSSVTCTTNTPVNELAEQSLKKVDIRYTLSTHNLSCP